MAMKRSTRPVTSGLSWTQSVCSDCWYRDNPAREPVRFVPEERATDQCCKCGIHHRSGIYIRVNPATVSFPS